MSNNEAVVFYCPSCGASIAMHGDQGTCAFCGTAIERPKSAEPLPARPPQDQPPVWNGPSITIARANISTRRRGGSCLGTLLVLLTVIGAAFGIGAGLMGKQLFSLISSSSSQFSQLPAVLNQIKLGS